MWADVGLVVGAYLYGSIPFVWWMAKLKGVDLRRDSLGSVSTTSLYHSSGLPLAILGGLGDLSKGILPVVIGYYVLDFRLAIVCLAGFVAILGQNWPIFLKFCGGRGASVSLGVAFTLALVPTFIALIPFLGGMVWRTSHGKRQQIEGTPSRIVPLGMLASFAILPLIAWLWGEPQAIILTFVGILLLVVIRRLTADLGRELREKPEGVSLPEMLLNRFLYDRSERDRYRR